MHKVADGADRATVGQSQADTCCAASERQDASQLSITTVAPPALVPLLELFAQPSTIPGRWVDRHRPPPLLANRQLPTHLLHSVFLI